MPNLSQQSLPFGLTRFLSWVSLVLILGSSIILAFFIGNYAQGTLLNRQQEYALLMAGNLNQQIYRRFTLPTFLTFGRIALRQPVQFQQLDEVVQSTILGLKVESLRIFGSDKIVNYSIYKEELGAEHLTPAVMDSIMETGVPAFEIIDNVNMFEAMFSLNLPPRSKVLRTMFPLLVNLGQDSGDDSTPLVTGVLEITQDITEDYDYIIRFQWLILATCLGSSTILFALLQFFIFKAERILTARMQENSKLEAELHQSEKLASMGRVTASIAHEIRNPLGIIRSSAEFLLKKPEEAFAKAANQRILNAIYDESCRLSKIVTDFLDYARPKIPRQELVEIGTLIEQALTFLEGEMKSLGIEQIHHLPPGLQVYGDKDLIYRSIYNILVNAIQAIEKDGMIKVQGYVRKNNVEISVQDSGPGISPELLPRLQDPFFTTKDHGTGLGLAIVKSIITSHNGTLSLENSPEGGAVVRIVLPKAEKN